MCFIMFSYFYMEKFLYLGFYYYFCNAYRLTTIGMIV